MNETVTNCNNPDRHNRLSRCIMTVRRDTRQIRQLNMQTSLFLISDSIVQFSRLTGGCRIASQRMVCLAGETFFNHGGM